MGRRLLQKMERTAAIAKCEVIILRLSTAAEGAIKFHIRHGFHTVTKIFLCYVSFNFISVRFQESCPNSVFTIIDMFQSVILKKEVKCEATSSEEAETLTSLTRSEHLSTVPE